MTSAAYPHLFTPIRLGGVELPNRLIMGSMHMGLENRGQDYSKLGAFYAERARGGVGLIVTGGFSPNLTGLLDPTSGTMSSARDARKHRVITEAVHQADGRIALQLLHAGRYGYHPLIASASRRKSPITPFTPRALSTRGVEQTVKDFVRAAGFARQAGYDGVEIMGSEGYLINQFLSPRTNDRTDAWGGTPARRRRLATEIVRRIRAAAGPDFLITFRMSMVDLVPDGQTLEETLDLARALETAGVDLLNTGIGWHEARVPTIVTSVPRAAFVDFTRRVKEVVSVPVAASNRINMPQTAEQILAEGQADLVSMARPFLADPDWALKAQAGSPERINTCIACNQACLDHTFQHRNASCLVNPRAGRETEEPFRKLLPVRPISGTPAPRPTGRRIAVVGAGPAGLAAATTAASLGHQVDLFEADAQIGGQFRLARQIPGKEEFAETLRYFRQRIEDTGVALHLERRVTAEELAGGGYDHVILSTGVLPREVDIPGADRANVHSYADVVDGKAVIGPRVAIIGAGGIGFDVAELLTEPHSEDRPFQAHTSAHEPQELGEWQRDWGVDASFSTAGGVQKPHPEPSPRQVYLVQRKTSKMGAGLGKTTGWVHRAAVKARGVEFITGATYERIDDLGLHLTVQAESSRRRPAGLAGQAQRVVEAGKAAIADLPFVSAESPSTPGEVRVLEVDDVVICAGQVSCRELTAGLDQAGVPYTLVGGADVAAELDAKRAIEQATRVAAEL
ncbi:FAD-dependent oxidoreductase [Micrococcus terreus]|uniref:oxidoreductase n=1 Tax=Micrococcus terreus TaxID=574650 RepID=UPI003D73B141